MTRLTPSRSRPALMPRKATPDPLPRMTGEEKIGHSGAVDAFCTPQKPNSAPATRRIWISSEPSVMR